MEYKEGYLAFIDILGFSSFVSDDNNASKTYDLFEFVRKFRYLFNDSPELNINVSFFSDSIVLTASELERLIVPIYIAESYIQEKMGLLFRGGICYGKYYHENDVTFGPAVVKAYKLEGKAVYSRIIIDNDIKLSDKKSIFYHLDIDGYTCLNPLSAILNEPVAYGVDGPVYSDGDLNQIIIDCFSKHRDEILSKINRYKGTSIIDKYLWRVRPFNYTCNFFINLPCGEILYKEIGFEMNEQLQIMLKQQLITEQDIVNC